LEVSFSEVFKARSVTDASLPILPPQSSLSRRFRALADMRGVWSLGDQGIVSLGNFLTSWLLLRSQSIWYGNYFTVINIIWFLNNLHMALVTYPISVTSAGISDSELRRRVRRALGMTLLLVVPESIVLCYGTAVAASWRLVPWAILALGLWQLQETTRRALMARLEHRRAIFGDFCTYIGQAAAIWFVLHRGPVSIEMVYAIIGITSGIALLIQAYQLGLHLPSDSPPTHSMSHQARHHLSLGQWVLMINLLYLLSIYSIPWFMQYFHGPAGVAMYSALLLVLNVSNPLLASVANLITPVVAKVKTEAHARGETGAVDTQRVAVKYAAQGAAILFPFFAFLLIAPRFALHLFYKPHSPYLQLSIPLRVFTVAYILMYVSAIINSYLCGLGKSRLPFFGQVANATVTCLITLPLVAIFGVSGAAWGSLFPVIAQLCFGVYFVSQAKKWLHHEDFPRGFEVVLPATANPEENDSAITWKT
jgi:O-antigen/teichoic acid export membrane protein